MKSCKCLPQLFEETEEFKDKMTAPKFMKEW